MRFSFFSVFLIVFLFSPFLQSSYALSSQFNTSITISPVLLPFGVVLGTAEIDIEKNMSIAGILGGGKYIDVPVFAIGGQLNYYAIGDFQHGMQLGVQVVGIRFFYDEPEPIGVLWPYVGYKIAAGSGLTVELQAGEGVLMGLNRDFDTGLRFLGNLNVGWSF